MIYQCCHLWLNSGIYFRLYKGQPDIPQLSGGHSPWGSVCVTSDSFPRVRHPLPLPIGTKDSRPYIHQSSVWSLSPDNIWTKQQGYVQVSTVKTLILCLFLWLSYGRIISAVLINGICLWEFKIKKMIVNISRITVVSCVYITLQTYVHILALLSTMWTLKIRTSCQLFGLNNSF